MDAMDLNWCLTCNRHIDSDAQAPYCSRECLSSDRPSTSQPIPIAHHHRAPSYSYADSLSELDDYEWSAPAPSAHSASTASSREQHIQPSAWIGKGAAGIHAWASTIHPGAPSSCASAASSSTPSTSSASLRPPKLLLSHQRRVAPTLCMSKTIPAPARPALTPQQSLPSLISAPTESAASSSLSLATPPDAPRPARQKTLMGALTAHLRWAVAPADAPRASRAPSPDCVSEESFLAVELDRKLRLGAPLDEREPWQLPAEKRQPSAARPIDPAAHRARGRRAARVS